MELPNVDEKIPSHVYIFDRKFKCLVPQLDTTSKEYLKRFGMPSTGDKKIDIELANQLITTYKSIAEMVDLYSKGVSVRIPKMSDCKLIYEFVEYHIVTWRNQLQRGLNNGQAPIDDLIAMDSFATAIYPYALANNNQGEVDSIFVRHLGQYKNASNILGTKFKMFELNQEENKEPETPKRESYSHEFANHFRGAGWR